MTPADLVRKGLCDPIKLFIKDEPHKRVKLDEGRLRLIFSVSLIDNLIARLLFSRQNKAEIAMNETIPVKPGMSLTDEGLAKINSQVKYGSTVGLLAEADIKGWDWCFQEYNFSEDLERRTFLNEGKGTDWERIARAHYHCMSLKVMALSNGDMYQQIEAGIMPSGWYNTSSTNSSARILDAYTVHMMAGGNPKFAIANGDDTVETYVPDAVCSYALLGKTVGLYGMVSSDNFEFCSTQFDGNSGFPLNVNKQLINFFMNLPKTHEEFTGRYSQFIYEMRNHPELDVFIDLIHSSGWWKLAPDSPWDGWRENPQL